MYDFGIASVTLAVSHWRRWLFGPGKVPTYAHLFAHDSTPRPRIDYLQYSKRVHLEGLDKDGHEAARGFYLEAWNGTGRYTYDRIGRGTIDIDAAVVSMIGTIQPSRLAEYVASAVRGGSGDDGLIQRFQLAVWPDCPSRWRNVDRWPDTKAKGLPTTWFVVWMNLARQTWEPSKPTMTTRRTCDSTQAHAQERTDAQNDSDPRRKPLTALDVKRSWAKRREAMRDNAK